MSLKRESYEHDAFMVREYKNEGWAVYAPNDVLICIVQTYLQGTSLIGILNALWNTGTSKECSE